MSESFVLTNEEENQLAFFYGSGNLKAGSDVRPLVAKMRAYADAWALMRDRAELVYGDYLHRRVKDLIEVCVFRDGGVGKSRAEMPREDHVIQFQAKLAAYAVRASDPHAAAMEKLCSFLDEHLSGVEFERELVDDLERITDIVKVENKRRGEVVSAHKPKLIDDSDVVCCRGAEYGDSVYALNVNNENVSFSNFTTSENDAPKRRWWASIGYDALTWKSYWHLIDAGVGVPKIKHAVHGPFVVNRVGVIRHFTKVEVFLDGFMHDSVAKLRLYEESVVAPRMLVGAYDVDTTGIANYHPLNVFISEGGGEMEAQIESEAARRAWTWVTKNDQEVVDLKSVDAIQFSKERQCELRAHFGVDDPEGVTAEACERAFTGYKIATINYVAARDIAGLYLSVEERNDGQPLYCLCANGDVVARHRVPFSVSVRAHQTQGEAAPTIDLISNGWSVDDEKIMDLYYGMNGFCCDKRGANSSLADMMSTEPTVALLGRSSVKEEIPHPIPRSSS